MSKSRLKKRGYNQSLFIAQEIATTLGNTLTLCKNTLTKTKETLPQTKTRSKSERLSNLKGCFSVEDAFLFKNKNVIIFDDVVTTGATFAECRKTLLSAGAREVFCFAIAH